MDNFFRPVVKALLQEATIGIWTGAGAAPTLDARLARLAWLKKRPLVSALLAPGHS